LESSFLKVVSDRGISLEFAKAVYLLRDGSFVSLDS
jgi:hypothetical protein